MENVEPPIQENKEAEVKPWAFLLEQLMKKRNSENDLSQAQWRNIYEELLSRSARRLLSRIHLKKDEKLNQEIYNNHQDEIDFFLETIDDSAEINFRTREQTDKDVLTGLPGRGVLGLAYENMIEKVNAEDAAKARKVAVMLFIDMDHLKRYNDTYGHGVGDLVVKEFGRRMGKTLRGTDIACRWGGDEFVILLPDVPAENVEVAIKRVLESLKSLVLVKEGNKFKIFDETKGAIDVAADADKERLSLSAGVYLMPYGKKEYATIDAAISRVDRAAYAAKEAGRNRVTIINTENDTVGEVRKFDPEGKLQRQSESWPITAEHELTLDRAKKKVSEALSRTVSCIYRHNNGKLPPEATQAIETLGVEMYKYCNGPQGEMYNI